MVQSRTAHRSVEARDKTRPDSAYTVQPSCNAHRRLHPLRHSFFCEHRTSGCLAEDAAHNSSIVRPSFPMWCARVERDRHICLQAYRAHAHCVAANAWRHLCPRGIAFLANCSGRRSARKSAMQYGLGKAWRSVVRGSSSCAIGALVVHSCAVRRFCNQCAGPRTYERAKVIYLYSCPLLAARGFCAN
eukprot:IDg23265t1